jgi:hypothetical protein
MKPIIESGWTSFNERKTISNEGSAEKSETSPRFAALNRPSPSGEGQRIVRLLG